MKQIKDIVILYIEDDTEMQEMIANVLHYNGYKCIGAQTGLEGIKKASKEKPDLILMDILLPDLQGDEVTTLLKSYKQLQSTPIIALTAVTDENTRQRTLSAGCDGYITKPIKIPEFLKKIEDYLKGKKESLSRKDEIKFLEEYKVVLVEKLRNKIQELENINSELVEANEQLNLSRTQLTDYNNRLFHMNTLANLMRLQTTPEDILNVLPSKMLEGFEIERCIIFEFDTVRKALHGLYSAGTENIKIDKLKIPFSEKYYDELKYEHKILWIKNEDELHNESLKSLSDQLASDSFIIATFSEQKKVSSDTKLYKKINDMHEIHHFAEDQQLATSKLFIFLDRGKTRKSFKTYEVRIIKSFIQSTSVIYENMFLYHKLYDLYQITQREAVTDPLTGLHNYRYFEAEAEREILRSKRHGKTFSLCIIDLDNFKEFNDTYGHPAGDRLLKSIAVILDSNTRKTDIVARYGGDEFIIILPELAKKQSKSLAEKLVDLTHQSDFKKDMSYKDVSWTISAGISSFPEDGESVQELLQKADKAMYVSKKAGKNKVSLA